MSKILFAILITLLLIAGIGNAVEQTELPPFINQIAGTDEISTAVEVSKEGWDNADNVVITRVDEFPDALAGTVLAYQKDGPILLTPSESLDSRVRAEIQRLGAGKAYILGGTTAINPAVESELKGLGLEIKRLGGANRYETAALIADEVGVGDKAVVAYGENFPDALAVGPYAARNGYPILLTLDNQTPEITKNALSGVSETVAVGGPSVISESVKNQLPNATRAAGADRYATAVDIIDKLGMEAPEVYLASGLTFSDALVGSVLAAKEDAPLLLVRPDRLSTPTRAAIKAQGTKSFVIIGNPDVKRDIESVYWETETPEIPDEYEDMVDHAGRLKPEYSRYYIEKTLDSFEFTDDGLKGHIAELPEGQNWDLRFTLESAEGKRFALNWGWEQAKEREYFEITGEWDHNFPQGESFEIGINWDKVERAWFSVGPRRDGGVCIDSIVLRWPEEEREERFRERW